MATPEQIQQWRDQVAALEARYQVLIGGSARTGVRMSDRSIEYAQSFQSDRASIKNEISRLKALIAGKRPGVGRINYVTPY